MSKDGGKNVAEKLILFAVFIVFAVIVVMFSFKWNSVGEDESDVTSFQYVTSKKAQSVAVSDIGSTASENESHAESTVSDSSPININTATAAQLDTLPGIGAKKAEAIIEYRENNGPFLKIEDIKNVSGIGDKIFEQLRELITVG